MVPILYVDDEELFLELGKGFLELKGAFAVDTVTSAQSALNLIQSNTYEAVISDYQMPGMNGIELLKELRHADNDIPFILFTGKGREEVVIQALNEGADYYLQKGGDPESLFAELSHKLKLSIGKRKAEAALIQSEEQSRILLEHIQDGAFLSQDGILLLCNETLAGMMGYSKEEIIGRAIVDLIAPEDRQNVLERHIHRLSGKTLPESYEFNLLHKDGSTRIPVNIFVGTGSYQGHPAVIGTLHNMTRERERESALQKSEKKYREIFNNAPIGLFSSTLEGRFIRANPSAVKNLGYESEEEFIHSITDIGMQRYVDPLERDEIARKLREEGSINNYETRFYRKDGSIIWGSFSARIVEDDDGKPVIDGICQDISARKEIEIALRTSEKRLQWVYESGILGVIFYTMDGRITDANDTFLAMLGYSRDDLIAGRINGFDITPPEYATLDAAAVKELLETGCHKRPYEKEYLRKDGTRIPVVLAGSLLDDEKRSGVGFVLDITDRKEIEDTLRRVNHQLTMMSEITRHDLMNQLSLIYGYLDLADPCLEDPSNKEIFEKIRSATDVIKAFIGFTRVYQELGNQKPRWQQVEEILPFSLVPEHITLQHDLKGIEIYADLMLNKVFSNLLDNSIRHGGHVHSIRVFHEKTDSSLTIIWEDDGVGINPEKKDKIFNRGYGDNTGLGLFLVRDILAETGITIRETGAFGEGARFEILVPSGAFRISR